MLSQTSDINVQRSSKQDSNSLVEDYRDLLQCFRIPYKEVDYYLQVGETKLVQGWILDISVVRSQLLTLLKHILPILIRENVAFKIVKDRETAKNVLDGNAGEEQIGKVISIYPEEHNKATSLATQLIAETKLFKGPSVPTDVHLGGLVFTRYGGINPIKMSNPDGSQINLIYDHKGHLQMDEYSIPFKLLEGLEWPFTGLASPIPTVRPKVIRNTYRPISNLKTDPRGDVIKALYLHRYFQLKWCVIKTGKLNMWSDDHGRDVPMRLMWQRQLHTQLSSKLPLPKIIDWFTENDQSFLVMEYCKGNSLYNELSLINRNSISWRYRPNKEKQKVIEYALKIIDIAQTLHDEGIVHRDLTPVNFIVDSSNKLVPIDLELAWSINENLPNPPFPLGTAGFMSPEQERMDLPSIEQDIYSIGATLCVMFTGLPPATMANTDQEVLISNLDFFLNDLELSSTIALCEHRYPLKRPALADIRKRLVNRTKTLSAQSTDAKKQSTKRICADQIEQTVRTAINGLCAEPVLMDKMLWVSPLSENPSAGRGNTQFTIKPGLHSGISGVVYFLARAKKAGYNISENAQSFNVAWKHLRQNYFNHLPNVPPGLYGGAAGVALATAEAMETGLVEVNRQNKDLLLNCLRIDCSTPDVANGVSGQGLAAIICKNYLNGGDFKKIVDKALSIILRQRNKRILWVWEQLRFGRRRVTSSVGYGNSGIILFLIEYHSHFPDPELQKVIEEATTTVIRNYKYLKQNILGHGFYNTIQNQATWENYTGTLMILIRSYESKQILSYRKIAEQLLELLPAHPVYNNFDQETGLAGLGEMYLEASRVFQSAKWKERADWIVNIFIHTSKQNNGACYWLWGNSSFVTADLMVGNGGIIHFLLRYLHPEKIGYRIFSPL